MFELLDNRARGKTCEAIHGILEEGKEVMEEFKGCEALDAGLLAAAQAVEHYEISRYGTLKTWAEQLGMKDAAKLLDRNLQEEKKTDVRLTDARGSLGQPRCGGLIASYPDVALISWTQPIRVAARGRKGSALRGIRG